VPFPDTSLAARLVYVHVSQIRAKKNRQSRAELTRSDVLNMASQGSESKAAWLWNDRVKVRRLSMRKVGRSGNGEEIKKERRQR